MLESSWRVCRAPCPRDACRQFPASPCEALGIHACPREAPGIHACPRETRASMPARAKPRASMFAHAKPRASMPGRRARGKTGASAYTRNNYSGRIPLCQGFSVYRRQWENSRRNSRSASGPFFQLPSAVVHSWMSSTSSWVNSHVSLGELFPRAWLR